MTKLNWDDSTYRGGFIQWARYRGLVILAQPDDSPANPLEDWDCEPPTAVIHGRGEFSEYKGEPLACLAGITDSWLVRHSAAVAKALEMDPAEFHREAKERQAAYGGRLIDYKRDDLERALGEMTRDSDYLESVAAVWNLRGVVARTWASNGYSQGDYATGLSVATPDWAKATGAPKSSHAAQCDYAGKLWGFWAWGDVYGFTVSAEPDFDGDPDSEPDFAALQPLDSCWGYYGPHDESGLEETATGSADHIADTAAKRRGDCLKALIRNRVPLALRSARLADAGAFTES